MKFLNNEYLKRIFQRAILETPETFSIFFWLLCAPCSCAAQLFSNIHLVEQDIAPQFFVLVDTTAILRQFLQILCI